VDRSESSEQAPIGDGIPYAPASNVVNLVRLVEVAARFRKAMSDSATGPLRVAEEVMAIANEWDRYADEADGLSCTAWLSKNIGKGCGLAFFKRRFDSVEALGEDVRRWMHHDAAVWVAQRVPAPQRKMVKEALYDAHCLANRTILTPEQTKLAVRKIIGKGHVRAKTCQRCQQLERMLKEHGVAVPGK
jgi:hypothetical protein